MSNYCANGKAPTAATVEALSEVTPHIKEGFNMSNSNSDLTISANALTFNFSAQALRVVMRDGEPWFVAADVCAALGIQRTSDAVEKLDSDEKGTDSIRTLGGEQKMLIVNESGLNAIILRCRDAMTPGTPAHKYRKWVTSEVLPAIRKTGRYVEPQPAPSSAREKLNASDSQHMKRIVWFAARNFRQQESASQGIWHHLRQVTHNPAPNAYGVEHIPVLAAELRRVIAISDQVGQITRHVEEQAIKRIFRKGEAAEKVLAHLAVEAARSVQQLREHVAKFPVWMESDLISFTERHPSRDPNHYIQEQPDFFLSVA